MVLSNKKINPRDSYVTVYLVPVNLLYTMLDRLLVPAVLKARISNVRTEQNPTDMLQLFVENQVELVVIEQKDDPLFGPESFTSTW